MKMKIVGLADGWPTTADGRYLRWCDVDARGGQGEVFTTSDKNEAMEFKSTWELLEYWRRQSTVTPLRPDRKPNRPLTAYTIEAEP